MAAIFGESKIFFENCQNYNAQIPCGSKISTECFILHGEGDNSKFVFFHFWQKFKKFKMATIFGEENFLKIANSAFLDTLWVENLDEITLSRIVKEIEANLCFSIFGKNSKNF